MPILLCDEVLAGVTQYQYAVDTAFAGFDSEAFYKPSVCVLDNYVYVFEALSLVITFGLILGFIVSSIIYWFKE